MMLIMLRTISLASLLFALAAAGHADELTVEILDEPAPADEISKAIATQLSPQGFAVKRSKTSTLCNIWLAKEWKVAADFKPTADVLYPFTSGQLIGVVQYKRRGGDFRDQDLDRGVYTLRYALQPVDGNHVGTSPTRDFLLVVAAAEDESPEAMDVRKLYMASAEAAQSSHPGLLLMQQVPADADASKPTSWENDNEWALIRIAGTASAGEKSTPQAIDLVVVGHADE
jgi:hypothetical protein